MARRILDIYYSTTKKALTDASDSIIARDTYPHVAYREQALARIRLRGYNGTDATAYQGMVSGEEVNAAIDTVFQSGEMVHSTSSAINQAGDWSEADVAKGKLAIRLDCTRATFLTRMGTDGEKIAWFEIQTAASGGTSPQGIFRFPIWTRNTIYTGALS